MFQSKIVLMKVRINQSFGFLNVDKMNESSELFFCVVFLLVTLIIIHGLGCDLKQGALILGSVYLGLAKQYKNSVLAFLSLEHLKVNLNIIFWFKNRLKVFKIYFDCRYFKDCSMFFIFIVIIILQKFAGFNVSLKLNILSK